MWVGGGGGGGGGGWSSRRMIVNLRPCVSAEIRGKNFEIKMEAEIIGDPRKEGKTPVDETVRHQQSEKEMSERGEGGMREG